MTTVQTVREVIEWTQAADSQPPVGVMVLLVLASRPKVQIGYVNERGQWRLSLGSRARDVTHWAHFPTGPDRIA